MHQPSMVRTCLFITVAKQPTSYACFIDCLTRNEGNILSARGTAEKAIRSNGYISLEARDRVSTVHM